MNKRVTDLSVMELEALAGEAWRSAAREALAKGLSVTGSYNGRRYRYHPDGRVEDLGPVHDTQANQLDEMPAAFREFAERAAAQAMDNYEKMKAAAEEATDLLETTYSTATKGASDYSLKVIEAARANTNAAFDFAGELLAAKTISEVVELASAHARKQFEAMTQQSKELGALAEKLATKTKKLAQHDLSKSFKKSS